MAFEILVDHWPFYHVFAILFCIWLSQCHHSVLPRYHQFSHSILFQSVVHTTTIVSICCSCNLDSPPLSILFGFLYSSYNLILSPSDIIKPSYSTASTHCFNVTCPVQFPHRPIIFYSPHSWCLLSNILICRIHSNSSLITTYPTFLILDVEV